MRKLCLLLALAIALPGAAAAGGGPENVLVVANDSSKESLELAYYYMHRRGIPKHHIVHLGLTNKRQWLQLGKYADFETLLEKPVKAWIAANKGSHITTIVLSRDVPVTTALARQGTGKIRDTRRSTAHMLAVMDVGYGSGKTAESLNMRAVFSPLNRSNHNASIDPRKPVMSRGMKFPVYCVNTINTFSVDDSKEMIDRAIVSEKKRPKGTVYLGVSKARDPRGFANRVYPQLKKLLEGNGFPTEIVPHPGTKVLLTGKQDVLAFQFGQAGWDFAFPGQNKYVPGALVDNVTSVALTAGHFKKPKGKPRGQTPMTFFIQAGASSVHGCVSEPYTAAFDGNHRHITRYLAGFNVIESYYMAHPLLPWMNLVAADPLMQPFAQRPTVDEKSFEKSGDGYKLSVTAKATRDGAGIARLLCYVNGFRLGEQKAAEATFELKGFDPLIDTAVVVAIDDSRFESQGRFVKHPGFAEVGTSAIEFDDLKAGKARFTLGSKVLFSWYAPGCARKHGTARGDELVLAVAGGKQNTVDIWVHTDPTKAPITKHFDLDSVLLKKAMSEARKAKEAKDMARLARAVAVLSKLTLDKSARAYLDEWKQEVNEHLDKEWTRLEKSLRRSPNQRDIDKLEAFAKKYDGMAVGTRARDRIKQIRASADEKAKPVFENATALLEKREWVKGLDELKRIVSRWPLSGYALKARQKIKAVQDDPEAKKVLSSAKSEAAAERLYRMAKMAKANGQSDLASKYLSQLLEKYPDSKAGQKAKREMDH